MVTAATVKTRILIISDTHCAPLTDTGNKSPTPPFKAPLPKADVLVHCGDLTYNGKMDEYAAALDMLKQIEAPVKLVIAGNHDLSLDRDFVFSHTDNKDEAEIHVRAARDLWTAPTGRAVKEGITFLDEGVHQISLPNGANISLYATPYTPEFYDWGFPYQRHEDRFNTPGTSLSDASNIAPYPVPSLTDTLAPVDLMVTHGPPYGRLDETNRGDLAGCPHLLRAIMRARPRLHTFGHIHEGHGAERISWSTSADQSTQTTMSTADWQNGGWKTGIEANGQKIQRIETDPEAIKDRHAIFVDVSEGGGTPLVRGRETLLVNAAIMDVSYNPVNAPWVVDIDLPKAT